MIQSIFSGDPFDKRSPFKIMERARRRRLVRGIATGVIPGLTPIVILLGFVIVRNPSWQGAVSLGVTILIILLSLAARALAEHDNIIGGGYILLSALTLIVGVNGVLIEGFEIAVAPSYMVIVVMAGMMLGVTGGIHFSLIVSALWLGAQFGIWSGFWPEPLETVPAFVYIAQAFVVVGFFFTAYMSFLSTEDLQIALDDATYALVAVNRKLEDANKDTRQAWERVEAILNNSPDAIILLRGPDGGVSEGNLSFNKLFKIPEGQAVNDSIVCFVTEEYQEQFKEALMTVIGVEDPITLEVVARTLDQDTFHASIALAPISGGELVRGIVCSIRDVSERVEAEEQVIKSLGEKEVLLQEVHHRVKNNLQLISSLLNLQIEEKGNPHTNQILSENRSRILSMARVHEQLYRSVDFSNVNLEAYLTDLVDEIFSYSGSSVESIKTVLKIANISLGVNKTIYFGLIVNELVSNSLQHAFSEGQSGVIEITLDQSEDGKINLTVRDTGKGFPDGFNFTESNTLGLSLVTMLTEQLGGEVSLTQDEGSKVRVTFAA